MLQLDPYLEIAKSAAFLAGAYIKDQQNKDLEILLNEGRDIKLQIDEISNSPLDEGLTWKAFLMTSFG